MHSDVLDFRAGIECTEREMSDEEVLFFRNGQAKLDVPRVRCEKVIKLTAPPPPEWRLQP